MYNIDVGSSHHILIVPKNVGCDREWVCVSVSKRERERESEKERQRDRVSMCECE